MSFWQKNLLAAADEERAERIMLKKKRKQDPGAKGLGAVAIPRSGPRAVHQRNEDRHVLRGKTASAMIGGEQLDVSLLNLSSNGVMIGCKFPVDIGEEISIAIEGCTPITTAVRWVRKGRIGLEFIAETEIIAEAGVRDYIVKTIRREADEATFGESIKVGTERRDIAKRHQLVWVGKLHLEGREATARLRNVSSTGAMLSLSESVGASDCAAVTLALSRVGRLAGTIRWHAGNELGIEFDEPFDVSLLVNESFAEIAPDEDAGGLGRTSEESEAQSDFDVLRVRLGNVENPHRPPEMEYRKLSMDEIYSTLYPEALAASGARKRRGLTAS